MGKGGMYYTEISTTDLTAHMSPLSLHACMHARRPACFVAGDKRGTYYNCRIDTYKSFMNLQAQGKARAIGVSNWEIRDLEQLFNATGQRPAVNQIEHHPYDGMGGGRRKMEILVNWQSMQLNWEREGGGMELWSCVTLMLDSVVQGLAH